jgi:hypothetical protein
MQSQMLHARRRRRSSRTPGRMADKEDVENFFADLLHQNAENV